MKGINRTLLTFVATGMELCYLFACANFLTSSVFHRTFPFWEAVGAFVVAALLTLLTQGRGWRVIWVLGVQAIGIIPAGLAMVRLFHSWSDSFLDQTWFVQSYNNPLLCDSSLGMHSVLSDLAEHCLLGRLESNNRFGVDPSTLGVRTQVLDAGEHGLDLSFGLSWLQPGVREAEPSAGLDLFADRFAPSAGMLGALRGETLSLEGTRWLGERGWLRVTGSSGRYQFDHALPGIATDRRRSALSLQAGRGAFAGSLVGHRTETNLNSKAWFDFDLGLSWRTPWSGKLTVGANNVLNKPGATADSNSRNPGAAEESRTPYVRYQQDL